MDESLAQNETVEQLRDEACFGTLLNVAKPNGDRFAAQDAATEMFFFGAPLAHVVQFDEHMALLRRKPADKSKINMARRRSSLVAKTD